LQGVDSGIKFLIKGLFVLLRIKIHRNQSGTREPLRFDGADLACQQCHGKIAPEAKFCPQCHAVILRRYCPGCKKLVPDHAPNCPYCGTSATQKSKQRILLDSTNATPLILVLSFAALFPSGCIRSRNEKNHQAEYGVLTKLLRHLPPFHLISNQFRPQNKRSAHPG
jgi:RNA polymerase subunit RPABC4/transcription elongation factor Spt4